MKINQRIKCAMGCLYELAKCPTEFMNCDELAQRQNLPAATAHKVLQRLAKGGLVLARKGVGYQLLRPLSLITALDVFDALSEADTVAPMLDTVTANFKSRVNHALDQVRLEEVISR